MDNIYYELQINPYAYNYLTSVYLTAYQYNVMLQPNYNQVYETSITMSNSREDGEPNKEGKTSEDPSDSASVEGDEVEDQNLEDNSNSSHSSRSSTPELPPAASSPLLLPPPPPPPPPLVKEDREMDLLNKVSATAMDISRNAVANPELIMAAEDDEDEGDEDMASSVATEDETPLDFSVKRNTEDESTDDDRSLTPNGLNPPSISQDGPLDLSVPRRKSSRSNHMENSRHAKIAKLETALSMPSSPWGYSAPKQSPKGMVKAAVVEVPMWNGKVKTEKRDKGYHSSSSKHSSLNRSNAYNPLLHKNSSPPLDSLKTSDSRKGGSKNDPYRPAGRQNPWQSQWMSRSSEQTRDVFTCVWCKEAFRSLAEMTVHMKQSPRCGMAGMQTTLPATSPTSTASAVNHQPSMHPSPLPAKCSTSSTSAAGPAANAVIKENVSLPRKLVRGQDVWLGKGAEQTRQILKCMWCGQSFKTLADMTTHMRVTQHYTNIISQEQIISWRTPEDKMAAQSQVNAVLTCKVCDQAFGSLKELSYHMVKNSHYKEHILRSITEGGGRRRQTRERRKKSLPVRKLLELERMELNKQNPTSSNDLINQAKNEVVEGKISCEECTEKVDAKDFVQHIKNCAQGSRSQHSVKSSPGSEGAKSTCASVDTNLDAPTTSGAIPSSSPAPSQDHLSEDGNKPSGGILPQEDSMCDSVESTGSTSVLNAIEKLIEKSFESKGRRNAVSTGILQRLGIDEEVYPPWHPSSSSPSAFGALRSSIDFQRKSTSPLGRLHDYKMDMADFSGSESRSRSSSTSEKHPNFDEHLRLTFGISAKDVMNRVSTPSSASQSCSPVHFQPESPTDDRNTVFPTKESTNSNLACASQSVARGNSSPKDRSTTPSSDRDNTEKNVTKDSELQEQEKESPIKETIDRNNTDTEDKVSDDEKPMDCSGAVTPKSEDRQTPLSRSSSCEPEMAMATSPSTTAGMDSDSPNKNSKSTPNKRKRNSEVHRKSHSSSKRRSHSHRKKDSEMGNNDGCDSVLGSPVSAHSSEVTSPRQKQHGDSAAGDHPLKELQKLLDKTDAHLSRPNLPATPGSILAFSWACSEATTSDSLMKCAFCDTHFISKGAYRHHLSKMHFVKDGSLAEIAAASTWKPPSTSGNSKTPPGGSSSSNGCSGAPTSSAGSRTGNNGSDPGHPASPQKELQPPAPADESPHSKFLKYTELAKQLSSKYV